MNDEELRLTRPSLQLFAVGARSLIALRGWARAHAGTGALDKAVAKEPIQAWSSQNTATAMRESDAMET